MPKSFLDADIGFPDLRDKRKSDEEKFQTISDYLFLLLEQLRYSLSNIDSDNFNEMGLAEITGPIYKEIQDTEGNIAVISVKADEIMQTVAGAAGDISAIRQTATRISTAVSDAQGNISSISQAAGTISSTVNSVSGDVSAIRHTATSISAAVQSADNNISLIRQTAESITSTVAGVTWYEEDYTINYYGTTEPSSSSPSGAVSGEYYLNTSNGYLYRKGTSAWSYVKTLSKMQNAMSTVTQTASTLQTDMTSLENTTLTAAALTMTAANGLVLSVTKNGTASVVSTIGDVKDFYKGVTFEADTDGLRIDFTKYSGTNIGAITPINKSYFSVDSSGVVSSGTFTTERNNKKTTLDTGKLLFYHRGSSTAPYVIDAEIVADQPVNSNSGSNSTDLSFDISIAQKALTLSSRSETLQGVKKTYYFALNRGLNPLGFKENFYLSESMRCNGPAHASEFAFGGGSDANGNNVYSDTAFLTTFGLGRGYVSLSFANNVPTSEREIWFYGSFNVDGSYSKNKVVKTKHYGSVALGAMESATPVFSDLGSGIVGEGRKSYIFFDPVFFETVEALSDYQVFVTQTGEGSISHVEKHETYFIVFGETGTAFDWIVYAKQAGFSTHRLEAKEDAPERWENDEPADRIFVGDDEGAVQSQLLADDYDTDMDALAEQYLNNYESEVTP